MSSPKYSRPIKEDGRFCIRVTDKERRRASSDGFIIVVRPDAEGGHNVFAVDSGGALQGLVTLHTENKSEIPAACTSIARDLSKFMGCGGKMASTARVRQGKKQYERKGK